ncbi:TetR/AcrR family transcriptional regulator [Herbiconiux flava]|uniref:AcrR family transcriptional regulator n=1 Tax=Herbiconiux flava TaxID=881268 RepID=A0A852SA46_9MICO|nr:TetR/AcrR family transcriptional regulator [Herbiconiux flava]NYD69156.1 AcrR family transcriptional regulator [Herbiconiux flava]GLK15904.1 TetR family transcriptional regulator [Herbiconiux flava]
MRPNNRTAILDAAVRVVTRDGLRGLTLEATAEEAGLTRGGMMYHFRDRGALVHALNEHLAREWDARLESAAGKAADACTPDERIAAYTLVTSSEETNPAELALILEASKNPTDSALWDEVQRRWTPTPAEAEADPAALDRFVLRLAADGLWAYDAISGDELPPALRRRLAVRIATLLAE